MKISWDGFEWGENWLKPEYRNQGMAPFYFRWCIIDKKMREAFRDKTYQNVPVIGLYKFWHDYAHRQLNLYFFCFYWSTQWTK